MADVSISLQDKLACVQREVRLRVNVYGRQVEQGKITQEWAEFQIACMRAIADDYAAHVAAQEAPGAGGVPEKEGAAP